MISDFRKMILKGKISVPSFEKYFFANYERKEKTKFELRDHLVISGFQAR